MNNHNVMITIMHPLVIIPLKFHSWVVMEADKTPSAKEDCEMHLGGPSDFW